MPDANAIMTARPEAYLTMLAYTKAYTDGVTLTPDPEAITRIGEITGEVDEKFALPVAANGLALVVRGDSGSIDPLSWDGTFENAYADQAYYPADQLALPTVEETRAISKSRIQATGRAVVEFTAHDFNEPLGVYFAGTLLRTFTHPNAKWTKAAILADPSGGVRTAYRKTKALDAIRKEKLSPFRVGERQ